MTEDWRPKTSITKLKERALIIQRIRDFFYERKILEVDTPVLSAATVTDLNIQSFVTTYAGSTLVPKKLYLQTSPEFAMKRLLAAGSGPIFQLFKSFRNGEFGDRHNPEFTMLEWYQPGYDHINLINEVSVFLSEILGTLPATRISYRELFLDRVNINPHTCELRELQIFIEHNKLLELKNISSLSKEAALDLIFTQCIEKDLAHRVPIAVYDFTSKQAALAKLGKNEYQEEVAQRFEFYYKGYEIANGFYELEDHIEQEERFLSENKQRENSGLDKVNIDRKLLAALKSGYGKCAGVAVGVDRLIMLALDCKKIADVIAFPIDIA